ncbi:hypothetical protein CBR_g4612 [Chara braunii]|uniref:Phosphate transporter n=1 Tax=Chara braunii TaxID=69332 RepID=A0A388KIA2_CHABU|nr:hypothetical protein CBR_g4612 [Chara braunii]|eukprot:GBG69781.1 hypothetical protein CBR_g4612 [Chara braunii]
MKTAHEHIDASQTRMAARANQSRMDHPFKVGDDVFIDARHLQLEADTLRKFQRRFVGPCRILQAVGSDTTSSPVSFRVKLPDYLRQTRVHDVYHVSLLRPYHRPSERFAGQPYERPPPIMVDGHEEFLVSDIIGRRVTDDNPPHVEYLVRWKGYPDEEATWEPLEHLQHARMLVRAYDRARRAGFTAPPQPTDPPPSPPAEETVEVEPAPSEADLQQEPDASEPSTVWVILVTWIGWPISSTHTIISSMVVLTFVLPDTRDAIDWHPMNQTGINPIYGIFLSWIVTPPAAALLSGVSFSALKWFVLQRQDSERRVLRFLPAVWALTAVTITLIVFFSFDKFKHELLFVPVLASLTTAAFVYAIAYQFGIPHARRRLKRFDSSLRRRVDAEVLELHESFTGGLDSSVRRRVDSEVLELHESFTGGRDSSVRRRVDSEVLELHESFTGGQDSSLWRRVESEVLELHESFTGGREGGGRRVMVEEEPTWHRDADDLGVPSAAVAAGNVRDRSSGREQEGGGGGIVEAIEDDGGHREENVVVVHGQEGDVRPPPDASDLRLPDGNLAPDGPNVLDGERRMRGGHEAREEGEDEGRIWDAIVDLYCRVEMHTFGRELVFSEATRHRQERAQRFCPRVEAGFYPLQILPACALAFAQGTNDFANQLAPFSLIYEYGTCHSLPTAGKYGMRTVVGIAVCVGFALMGYRVTRNIGGLTLMTPSRSFTCQVCAAFTVAMCSVKKVPVSTTQILIGSTIGVGAADNYRTELASKLDVPREAVDGKKTAKTEEIAKIRAQIEMLCEQMEPVVEKKKNVESDELRLLKLRIDELQNARDVASTSTTGSQPLSESEEIIHLRREQEAVKTATEKHLATLEELIVALPKQCEAAEANAEVWRNEALRPGNKRGSVVVGQIPLTEARV